MLLHGAKGCKFPEVEKKKRKANDNGNRYFTKNS